MSDTQATSRPSVTIYTDGACRGNPGKGGYGAVLLFITPAGTKRKEIAQGYRLTTNNRMEILAVIEALRQLTRPCRVSLFTDSQYVCNAINKGWAVKWRSNRWMRTNKDRAENADLWEIMLKLVDTHECKFNWVRGHAGNKENERCDVLAVAAAEQGTLLADSIYEAMMG
jgi:ribonuclease HI